MAMIVSNTKFQENLPIGRRAVTDRRTDRHEEGNRHLSRLREGAWN